MNGATEATLSELLQIAKQMNINIAKFTAQAGTPASGSSGIASAAGGVASLAKFAGPAGMALSVLSGAASLVGGTFNILGNIVGKTVTGLIDTGKHLYEFAKQAMDGSAKLSDLYNAFRDLPFFLGSLAGVFADIIRYSENLLGTYQQLTSRGASFSGSLFEMRDYATRAGLGFKEFSTIVSQNSELFATMGGNVQSGINKFTQASGALLGPKSEFSKMLFGLGYTAEGVAEGLTTVMLLQNTASKKSNLTADELAAKTADYLTELDALAKITGQSREEIDKKLKKDLEEQTFQVFLRNLTAGQRTALEEQIKVARTMGGEPAVQAVKNGARGIFAPLSKEATDFQVTSKGMYTKIAQDAYANLRNTNMSSAQQRTALFNNLNVAAENIDNFANGLGEPGLAMSGAMFSSSTTLMQTFNNARKAGMTLSQMYQTGITDQEAQKKGSAANLAQAEQNIKNFGNILDRMLRTLLGPITDVLGVWGTNITGWMADTTGELSEEFTKVINWVKDGLAKPLEDISKWFGNTYTYLSSSANVDVFWTRFKEKFSEGVDNVWKAVGPPLKHMWENDVAPMLGKALAGIFVGMLDYIIYNLRQNSAIARFLFNESTQEKTERTKAEADPVYQAMLAAEKARVDAANADALTAGPEAYAFLQNVDEAALLKKYQADQAAKTQAPQPKASGGSIKAGNYLVGDPGPNTELLKLGGNQTGDVISNENITALVNRAAEADKVISTLLQTLNTQNRQMLTYMSTVAEYTQRNNDALKDMSGDAFA